MIWLVLVPDGTLLLAPLGLPVFRDTEVAPENRSA
jgi:hypothetical protein